MRAVRHRQVQPAIAIEVPCRDRIAIGAPALARDADRGLEGAVAVPQQDPELGPASRHEVLVRVAIEVAHSDEILIVGRRVADRNLKRAVTVAEQDPELMGADRGGSAGDRHIQIAVPVEIADREGAWNQTGGRVSGSLKRPIPVPQQDRDAVVPAVGGDEVGSAVAVEVGDGHVVGMPSGRMSHGGAEGPIPLVHEDRDPVGLGSGNRKIRPAITVEVACRDGRGARLAASERRVAARAVEARRVALRRGPRRLERED